MKPLRGLTIKLEYAEEVGILQMYLTTDEHPVAELRTQGLGLSNQALADMIAKQALLWLDEHRKT